MFVEGEIEAQDHHRALRHSLNGVDIRLEACANLPAFSNGSHMALITRRGVLRVGLALPAVLESMRSAGAVTDATEKPKRFEEVCGFEIQQAISEHPLAILPLGSLEFRGPHNPLGVDSIIISRIVERVGARSNAVPTVTFTPCPAHTVAFSRNHFRSARGDDNVLCGNPSQYSSPRVSPKSSSSMGMMKTLDHDAEQIAQVADETKDAALLLASRWEFLPGDLMNSLWWFHQGNGGHGHGGPLENSAVDAFRPDLVHGEKARDLPEPPDLSGGVPYFLQKSTAAAWPGYSGHVSEASAEKGRKLVHMSEDGTIKLIENWLSHDEAPGSW